MLVWTRSGLDERASDAEALLDWGGEESTTAGESWICFGKQLEVFHFLPSQELGVS